MYITQLIGDSASFAIDATGQVSDDSEVPSALPARFEGMPAFEAGVPQAATENRADPHQRPRNVASTTMPGRHPK